MQQGHAIEYQTYHHVICHYKLVFTHYSVTSPCVVILGAISQPEMVLLHTATAIMTIAISGKM